MLVTHVADERSERSAVALAGAAERLLTEPREDTRRAEVVASLRARRSAGVVWRVPRRDASWGLEPRDCENDADGSSESGEENLWRGSGGEEMTEKPCP